MFSLPSRAYGSCRSEEMLYHGKPCTFSKLGRHPTKSDIYTRNNSSWYFLDLFFLSSLNRPAPTPKSPLMLQLVIIHAIPHIEIEICEHHSLYIWGTVFYSMSLCRQLRCRSRRLQQRLPMLYLRLPSMLHHMSPLQCQFPRLQPLQCYCQILHKESDPIHVLLMVICPIGLVIIVVQTGPCRRCWH